MHIFNTTYSRETLPVHVKEWRQLFHCMNKRVPCCVARVYTSWSDMFYPFSWPQVTCLLLMRPDMCLAECVLSGVAVFRGYVWYYTLPRSCKSSFKSCTLWGTGMMARLMPCSRALNLTIHRIVESYFALGCCRCPECIASKCRTISGWS